MANSTNFKMIKCKYDDCSEQVKVSAEAAKAVCWKCVIKHYWHGHAHSTRDQYAPNDQEFDNLTNS